MILAHSGIARWRSAMAVPPSAGRPPRSVSLPTNRSPRRHQVAGLLVVIVIAAFNLFSGIGRPAQPIWDESYYLTATARYELGYASFASHPPLGLMLIAAGDRLSGANRGVDRAPLAADKKIAGEKVPAGFSYFGVRLGSALFGVVAAGLMFLLMLSITGSVEGGLFATAPFLFDTALIAQFRAAQLDAFQLCFAAGALWLLVTGDRRRHAEWLFGFGAACGAAAMVRANGILLLAGASLPALRALRGPTGVGQRLVALARVATLIAAGTASTILAVFLLHLGVARRPMPSGWPAARADARFIGADYRAFLDGREPLSAGAALDAIAGYRRFMAADLAGVGRTDANGSSPWGWPLGRKPIVYRWDSNGRTTAYVALVPNLAAWAVSLLGVIGAVSAIVHPSGRRNRHDRPPIIALLVIWVAFMLSALALERVRVLYLYHYFIPLIIGWALAARLASRSEGSRGATRLAAHVGLALILVDYAVVAPFALHQPLTDSACSRRTMMAGAELCTHRVAQ